MDKAGHDSDIVANICIPEAGRCARVSNDPGSGRIALNSNWRFNAFSPALLCIELSSPVNPAANGVNFESSSYCLSSAEQVVAVIDGQYYSLPSLADDFGWELQSTLLIDEPISLLAPEDGMIDTPLEIDLDWQDAGEGDYELQLGIACGEGEVVQTTNSHYFWGELLPEQQYFWRVRARNSCDGFGDWSACFSFSTRSLANAVPGSPADGGLRLQFHGIFPNPTTRDCQIRFSLAESGRVSLEIFGVTGRKIRSLLIRRSMTAGDFSYEWDSMDNGGKAVPAGVYFSRLSMAGGSETRKIALIGK